MDDTIEKCKKLELNLERYKMMGGMIPRSTQRISLANLLPKIDWDTIREVVYKREGYKCKICGAVKVSLNAHEIWEYEYNTSTQRLKDIVALCHKCHMCHHLGFVAVSNMSKDYKRKLREHWCKVNNTTLDEYWEYDTLMWDLWMLRNNFSWKVVTPNDKPISSDVNIIDLLKHLHKNASRDKIS